ncbi:MAG: alpha/beta fold hydrolase [Chloroflexi bacterium]|nr:alpha/beta fold hydrolase [Chloroflexota bacterium]
MTNNPTFIKNPHLDGDDFFWIGNRTGILLIHGFTATTAEVRLLANKLHAEGFTVAGPLLPGHGTNPDDLNRATWPMWVEKVKHYYEKLLSRCDQIYIGGESMGGLLTLELAHQHPEISGLFLFAPAIKIKNLWTSRLLWPFLEYLKKEDKDDGLLWKGYTVNPVKAAAELHKLQKHVRRRLPEITQPVMIFTGEHDRTIAPESAEIILKKIGSKVKLHLKMENSGHCVILDRERETIFERVLHLINTRFNQDESRFE